MENQVVEYTKDNRIQDKKVNETLLVAIKEFVEDLTNVTVNKDFKDYCTIVNRIDVSKVKAYFKLIDGMKAFFEHNTDSLRNNNLKELSNPTIAYTTDNASFAFDFQQVYDGATEEEQEIIKDHLNHIWSLLTDGAKSPEELYIEKMFADLKSTFSPDLTREEQMMVTKTMFDKFQQQNLDMAIVIKMACKKARELLEAKGSEADSKTLLLIDAVEDIDVHNFNMVQFMGLVSRVGTLFSDGESNPLKDLLSSLTGGISGVTAPLPIENLKIEDDHKPEDDA